VATRSTWQNDASCLGKSSSYASLIISFAFIRETLLSHIFRSWFHSLVLVSLMVKRQ